MRLGGVVQYSISHRELTVASFGALPADDNPCLWVAADDTAAIEPITANFLNVRLDGADGRAAPKTRGGRRARDRPARAWSELSVALAARTYRQLEALAQVAHGFASAAFIVVGDALAAGEAEALLAAHGHAGAPLLHARFDQPLSLDRPADAVIAAFDGSELPSWVLGRLEAGEARRIAYLLDPVDPHARSGAAVPPPIMTVGGFDALASAAPAGLAVLNAPRMALVGRPPLRVEGEAQGGGVLILCDFEDSDPTRMTDENQRAWIAEAISAAVDSGRRFQALAVRPRVARLDKRVVQVGERELGAAIQRADLVVAAFGGRLTQAAALGRPVVFFDPARESALPFVAPMGPLPPFAGKAFDLAEMLRQQALQPAPDAEIAALAAYQWGTASPDVAERLGRLVLTCQAAPRAARPEPAPSAVAVTVFSAMPRHNYSGGRYHAWALVEGLAAAGCEVTLVTDHVPVFYKDFARHPAHAAIRIWRSRDFVSDLPGAGADVVFVAPGMGRAPAMYQGALSYAQARGAHVALLNFETPNWFNQLVDTPRDPELWANWLATSRFVSRIVSSTEESRRHAEAYYENLLPDARHEVLYPPINDLALAQTGEVERGNRVIAFISRVERYGEHKGVDQIEAMIGPAFAGHTLVLLCGGEMLADEARRRIEAALSAHGAALEIVYRPDDRRKFQEMKAARLLLFPSQFEGFGYPPVEALAAGAACVAYDLPVLRETCGDHLSYAPRGDIAAFRDAVAERLASAAAGPEGAARALEIASFERFAGRLGMLVDDLAAAPSPWAELGDPEAQRAAILAAFAPPPAPAPKPLTSREPRFAGDARWLTKMILLKLAGADEARLEDVAEIDGSPRILVYGCAATDLVPPDSLLRGAVLHYLRLGVRVDIISQDYWELDPGLRVFRSLIRLFCVAAAPPDPRRLALAKQKAAVQAAIAAVLPPDSPQAPDAEAFLARFELQEERPPAMQVAALLPMLRRQYRYAGLLLGGPACLADVAAADALAILVMAGGEAGCDIAPEFAGRVRAVVRRTTAPGFEDAKAAYATVQVKPDYLAAVEWSAIPPLNFERKTLVFNLAGQAGGRDNPLSPFLRRHWESLQWAAGGPVRAYVIGGFHADDFPRLAGFRPIVVNGCAHVLRALEGASVLVDFADGSPAQDGFDTWELAKCLGVPAVPGPRPPHHRIAADRLRRLLGDEQAWLEAHAEALEGRLGRIGRENPFQPLDRFLNLSACEPRRTYAGKRSVIDALRADQGLADIDGLSDEQCAAAFEAKPNDPEGLIAMAFLLMRRGQEQAALEIVARALRAHPSRLPLALKALEIASMAGDRARTEEYMIALLAAYPLEARLYALASRIWADAGDLPKGLQAAELGLNLAPDDPELCAEVLILASALDQASRGRRLAQFRESHIDPDGLRVGAWRRMVLDSALQSAT